MRAAREPQHPQVDTGAAAHRGKVRELGPAILLAAPAVQQRGLGDHRHQPRCRAIGTVEDLLAAQTRRKRPLTPRRRPGPDSQQCFYIGPGLQQPGQHQRHVDADPHRVVLEPGELIAEDLVLLLLRLVPPHPGTGACHEIL